jgi:AcrR family transcriptional regulator
MPTIVGQVDGVKTRRTEYAEQTKVALLDAAAREFAAHGFAGTSIAQIAAAARVTKGAVYHHFPNKSGLFEAVLERCNEAAQQQVLAAIATHPTDLWLAALAALEATFDVCMDPIAGRLIYVEGPVGLGWSRWRISEERYTRHNIDLLLQGLVGAGAIPTDTPTEAMAQLLTGMITHAGITLAESPPRKRRRTRDELQAAMQQILRSLGQRSPRSSS